MAHMSNASISALRVQFLENCDSCAQTYEGKPLLRQITAMAAVKKAGDCYAFESVSQSTLQL